MVCFLPIFLGVLSSIDPNKLSASCFSFLIPVYYCSDIIVFLFFSSFVMHCLRAVFCFGIGIVFFCYMV